MELAEVPGGALRDILGIIRGYHYLYADWFMYYEVMLIS